MKDLLIIFEGVDKSGKTTIKDAFNKETNFKYWVLDRSFISSLVYNELFDRNDEDYYLRIMNTIKDSLHVLIVYCYADVDDVEFRLRDNNEVLPKQLQDISEVDSVYRLYIEHSGFDVLYINTSNTSVRDAVKKLDNMVISILNDGEELYRL